MANQTTSPAPWGEPVVINEFGQGPCVLVCEHAGRLIPHGLHSLGLSSQQLDTHIAWDIGAIEVAWLMSTLLDAPLIAQRFSRLVYDCNRPATANDAIANVSDGIEIPGNQNLTPEARQQRYREIYVPFEKAVARVFANRRAVQRSSALVTVHSFTPIFKNAERKLDLGVLHDSDDRLANKVLALLAEQQHIVFERNQPYGPEDGVTYTLKKHGVEAEMQNVMFEIRNNLLTTKGGQENWALRLSRLLSEVFSCSLRPIEIADNKMQ